MFVNRKYFNELVDRLEQLENYASNDYDRQMNLKRDLEILRKIVGKPTNPFGKLMYFFEPTHPDPEPTLTEVVEEIVDHLGLEIAPKAAKITLTKKKGKK